MKLNLSHHAYLLIDSDFVYTELISIIKKDHDIDSHANPDFFDRLYQTFTIDDAREVKIFHGMRPVSISGKKIFILRMDNVTVEAQNALLKLLEEPAEYAHFFIIISSTHLLLSTIKSRMQLIEIGDKDQIKNKKDTKNTSNYIDAELLESAEKFVKLSKAKKLEEVKKIIEDISKEKKTKQYAIDWLNAVQATIYEQKGVKQGRSVLEVIETARNYIHDRAPSIKMLLEYVALNL